MWTYVYADELYHHGVKGMKWGVRRYQNKDGTLTSAGRKRYSEKDRQSAHALSKESPKIKQANSDYIYSKNTVVGRFGEQSINDDPMYLFTNKTDRDVYEKRFGGVEQKFVLKKDVRIPDKTRQIMELYNLTKDDQVINDPYYYWKDHINQGGKLADEYFKHMRQKGYDALVDIRNLGISDDPILLLNPQECLDEVIQHSDYLMHYGVKGMK